jgi:hypothetical protein
MSQLNRFNYFVLLLVSCLLPAAGQGPVQLTFDPPQTGKDWPAWSPDGDWIAFVRAWWSGGQLLVAVYKIPAAGGTPVRISDVSPNLWQHRPTWSSDGACIYFEQKVQTSQSFAGIPARVPAQGGSTALLTTEHARDMALTKNGRHLFYVVAGRLGEPELPRAIRAIDTVTGYDVALHAGVEQFAQLQMAPSGSTLGFAVSSRISALSWTGMTTLYDVPPGCVFQGWKWSPGGDRLSLWAQGCFGSSSEVRWLRPFEGVGYPLAPNVRPAGSHHWSPSGTHLAYGGYWAGQNSLGIGAVEVPSGRTTLITNGFFDGGWPLLTWSPFSDEVAWVFHVSTTNTVELFKAPTGLPPTPAVVGTISLGSRVTIRLKVASDVGLPYVLGASFGTEPGVSTVRGRIPLNLDPLLMASVSNVGPFHFFRGILDGAGRAEAYLDLPMLPALTGARFFLAFVTLDPAQPAGIRTISGAVPVFVQPTG